MKKILTFFLCFALALSLCACGGNDAKTPDNEQEQEQHNDTNENKNDDGQSGKEDPSGSEDPAAGEGSEGPAAGEGSEGPVAGEGSEDPAAGEGSAQDMVELVKSYIDKPIEELYAVIGEPESSDYAPSCLGDGEDGMLIYDGFIVYTYREGDSEIVFDVE